MAVQVSCPHCRTSYRLSDQQVGQQVRCKKCNGVFQVKMKAPPASPLATAPLPPRPPDPPVLEEYDDDDIPKVRPSVIQQSKPARKSMVLALVLGAAALALILFGGIAVAGVGAWLYFRASPKPAVASNTKVDVKEDAQVQVPQAPVNAPEAAAKDLEELKAATVFIKVTAGPLRGSGSGFLIKVKADGNTGYIATNYHVVVPSIRGAPLPRASDAVVEVVFQSGTKDEHSHPAKVLARDKENDLAVLEVTGVANLPKPINLHAGKLVELTKVIVYGFPFGDKLAVQAGNPAITVSQGSISSIRRDGDEVVAVQIDGALNPGNSGGPVLDAEGRLVGVATATVPGAHIGLAVPAEELNRLIDGRVGEVSAVLKSTTGDTLQVDVETPLLDPLDRVKSVRVYYLRSDRVKDNLQREKGKDWAQLSGSEQLPLQIEGGKALGKLAIPAADKDRSFTFQLSFVNSSGRTVYTKPNSLLLRPQDTVVVRPPPDRPPFPDRPPPFPDRPGGNPEKPGVSMKPIKRPALAPFTAHVPDKDKEIVPLIGSVNDVTVAGAGRYLALHLSGKKKLAVFDVQAGKVVKELPLSEEPYHVAGGANRLVVIYPNAKLIQQFSLTTFEREKSQVLPGTLTSDSIHQVSMGSASAGPLFAYLPKEKRTLAVNLDTLETTEVRWSHWAPTNAYGPLTMRTSPDGTWLVGHGGGWAGCEVAMFNEGQQVGSHNKIEFVSIGAGAFALPSADGRFLFTPWAILNRSFTPSKVPEIKGCYIVPAAEPGPFFALANEAYGANPKGMLADGSLMVYSEDRRPLFALRGLEELKTKSDLAWEKRLHYYPRPGLLVSLDLGKDQIVLRRVKLAEQLEKSDTDYLVVVSQPPLAKAGAAFSYKLEVLSKKGGVKFKLESGPDGLSISPAGEVSWKVPAKPADPEVDVLVTVSDSSGQEVFHNFKIDVSSP
jgi:predicted Zn finger-like uncharacterized protein